MLAYTDIGIGSGPSMKPLDSMDGRAGQTLVSETETRPLTPDSESPLALPGETDIRDPHGPYRVQQCIQSVIRQWERVQPIAPPVFLTKLLQQRGYGDFLEHPLQAIDFKRWVNHRFHLQLLNYLQKSGTPADCRLYIRSYCCSAKCQY